MKYFFLLFIFFLCIGISRAQDFPSPMQPRRIVNDFTHLLSQQEQAQLEQKLRNFSDTTSTQIAIVTVPSLHGFSANDYAQRLAEQWGIGQKGKDNGILLLVKPKIKNEKGEVAISVGYGLEGVVPDAIASRIIRNEIIPEFQKDRYFAGLNKATDVLAKLTSGEYSGGKYPQKDTGSLPFIGIFILVLLIFIIITLIKGKGGGSDSGAGGRNYHRDGTFIFWGGLGGSGLGSSSGGESLGGFGGFGGGSFGGGGASGSW